MKLNDYIEQAKIHLKEYLPEEFQTAEIIIQRQQKNNNEMPYGLTLKIQGMNICPVVYLDNYYESYLNGMAMEDTFRLIGRHYLSAMNSVKLQQDSDLSFDHVKDKLFLFVVNAEKNQKMLATVPYQELEDLAILYRCIISSRDNGIDSIIVSNKLLDHFGISKEALHEQALRNMNRLFTPEIQSMEYIMAQIMELPYTEEEMTQNKNGLFVLSNTQRIYGASYLCCPDVLKLIGEKMDGNYLILPSSIHEIIVLKETADMDVSDLRAIVEFVNQTELNPTEYLSDNIYRYNCKNQSLSIMEGSDMQQGMNLLQ